MSTARANSLDEGKTSVPTLRAIVTHATHSLTVFVSDPDSGLVASHYAPLDGEELEVAAFELVDRNCAHEDVWEGHIAIGHDAQGGRVQQKGKGAGGHGGCG